MYAVVVRTNIDESQMEAGTKMLREQIVPMVRQSPGFVAGYWTRDKAAHKGYSMILFETEADARNQLASLERMAPDGPAPGVTWENKAVTEVVAEASK
jgi:hypothetical protein